MTFSFNLKITLELNFTSRIQHPEADHIIFQDWRTKFNCINLFLTEYIFQRQNTQQLLFCKIPTTSVHLEHSLSKKKVPKDHTD